MSSFNINNAIVGINIVPQDNEENIRISAVGNVGIGTTTPTQKLDVNGAFKSKRTIHSVVKIVPTQDTGTNYINNSDIIENNTIVFRYFYSNLNRLIKRLQTFRFHLHEM